MVTKGSKVDELVWACPGVVRFLIDRGLPCVVCGEPFWGTLEDLARQRGWDDKRIDVLVRDLAEVCESQ